MLKVEYPCRGILTSSLYKNPNKLILTSDVTKQHLHTLRLQRQSQIALNINECQRLQTIHKEIYNHQFTPPSIDKSPEKKADHNECPSRPKQYSIPRIKYAPIIYRQAVPTFELEPSSKLEKSSPIIQELTQYLSEFPGEISNDQIENNRSLSPIKHDRQRRHLSVSSILSIDKRANKVYEKWPDYNQISEIAGYRIDPPLPKIITSEPLKPINRSKRKTPTKQKKPSSRKSKKTDLPSIAIDRPPSPIKENIPPIKEIKPRLPDILCPSSIAYSNRLRTRQWLLKTNFSSNTIRTLPLL